VGLDVRKEGDGVSRLPSYRPTYERVVPVHDAAFYREWAKGHDCCMVCGRPGSVAAHDIARLTNHHIVKFRRSDEACNLLRVCDRDHRLCEMHTVRDPVTGAELPKLILPVVLTVKRLRDPGAWDPERLAKLFGRALPDPEPIPEIFLAEWRQWRGRA
jgi:hypothetical protein